MKSHVNIYLDAATSGVPPISDISPNFILGNRFSIISTNYYNSQPPPNENLITQQIIGFF